MVEVKVKRLYDDADMPLESSPNVFDIWLHRENLKADKKRIEYFTGLAFDIPEGYLGLVFPRLRLAQTHTPMGNAVGIIQPGNGDKELVLICQIAHAHFEYEEKDGENVCIGLAPFNKPEKPARLAQLVVIPVPDVELVEE